jgi:hypothetical protein
VKDKVTLSGQIERQKPGRPRQGPPEGRLTGRHFMRRMEKGKGRCVVCHNKGKEKKQYISAALAQESPVCIQIPVLRTATHTNTTRYVKINVIFFHFSVLTITEEILISIISPTKFSKQALKLIYLQSVIQLL